jgi:hypothetical protein
MIEAIQIRLNVLSNFVHWIRVVILPVNDRHWLPLPNYFLKCARDD